MVFLYSTRVEKSYLYFDSTKKLAIDDLSRFAPPEGCLRVIHFSERLPARKSTFHALADLSRERQRFVARYFFEITRQPVGLNASRDSFTRFECPPPQIQSCFQPLVFSPLLFSIDRSSACKVIVRG